jgi:hypothetical protein
MQRRFSGHYESIPIPPPSPTSSATGSEYSNLTIPTMDVILALSMLLKGTTPDAMAAERQGREEEELRAQDK